jgi:hypothetical protein
MSFWHTIVRSTWLTKMWFHILFRLLFFYVRRKCYVVFACCRVLVVRVVICSWFETTCESMWLALYMYSRLCVYYFCLHSNKIGSAVQCSTVFQESRCFCSIGGIEPQRVMRNSLGEMTLRFENVFFGAHCLLSRIPYSGACGVRRGGNFSEL